MNTLNYFFQLLPVILACIAAVACSMRFARDRRKHDRVAMFIAALSSVLLVIAQTSWWSSYILQGSLKGTEFANFLWTIFNTLTMVSFILIAQPRRNTRS